MVQGVKRVPGARKFAPADNELAVYQCVSRQATKKPGGEAGLECLIEGLIQAVAEFVVVEVHTGAVALEDTVVQELDVFAPDVEDAFAPLVIHAPEVSVAHFVVAVGQEDHLIALEEAVAGGVDDPDAVHVSADVIAVPKRLPVIDADYNPGVQDGTDPGVVDVDGTGMTRVTDVSPVPAVRTVMLKMAAVMARAVAHVACRVASIVACRVASSMASTGACIVACTVAYAAGMAGATSRTVAAAANSTAGRMTGTVACATTGVAATHCAARCAAWVAVTYAATGVMA